MIDTDCTGSCIFTVKLSFLISLSLYFAPFRCRRHMKTSSLKCKELRNNSTVLEELEVSIVDLTVANAVFLATRSGASKTIFATVKSTVDTDNSSNTVLLFIFLWNFLNVYTLVWKQTNKWRNICTFHISSAKNIVRQIHNWYQQLLKYSSNEILPTCTH